MKRGWKKKERNKKGRTGGTGVEKKRRKEEEGKGKRPTVSRKEGGEGKKGTKERGRSRLNHGNYVFAPGYV